MVDPVTRQHHEPVPMWQAYLTLVVPTADLGIADMMNCLQDQLHKLI